MIYLGIVLGDSGLYDLMKDKSNVSEREIYSFNAENGQIEAQAEDANVISIDFRALGSL